MRDFDSINWKSFRDKTFQSNDEKFFNFNPGTMGSCSNHVINSINNFISDHKNPLEIYKEGRLKLQNIRIESKKLWPNSDYEIAVGGSTTYWCNKLSDSFQKIWKDSDFSKPIKLISSTHEHKGALLNFENNPSFKVLKVNDEDLNNREKFESFIREFDPQIALFSQKTWDENICLPIREYFKVIKEISPETITILDSAQSIGIDHIEFGCSEIIVCSGQKLEIDL